MLLLHLMVVFCPERIRAIYINHQLQEQNAAWGEFVQVQAHQLNIPAIVETVQVQAGNLEQQAREARYQAFHKHLQHDDILVLAHHQQDQAETLLLRLFSGSGVQGLSAMRSMDIRTEMTIWRPLLHLTREQIAQWSQDSNIAYVTDPTNADTRYDRAWCREVLWPVLNQRFPKMQQAVARTSQLMQDADEILAEVLQQDLAQCGNAQVLHLEQLAELSQARQRQLLSVWMKGEGQYRPSLAMVERLQEEVIAAYIDRQAALHCDGYYYVRYQHQLFRLSKTLYLSQRNTPLTQTTVFKINTQYEMPTGRFKIKNVAEKGLSLALLGKTLTLSPRQGGERIHLYGRVGNWPLKKAINDAKIYPWLRHTIQILSIDNVMLGVFTPQGFWLADSSYCVDAGWLPILVSEITSI